MPANRVTWFFNRGPDNSHWMLECHQFASLREAKALAQETTTTKPGWVWAIIRGEDLPFEPGSRTMHSASSPATATYVHMWVSVLPGNKS